MTIIRLPRQLVYRPGRLCATRATSNMQYLPYDNKDEAYR